MSPGYKGGNVPPHATTAAADAYVAAVGPDGDLTAAQLRAAFLAGAAYATPDPPAA